MDSKSEMLMRAALHDLSNTLSGVQGVLDLAPVQQPLSFRDRSLCEAILSEGFKTIERARHLVLGTFPESALEPFEDWKVPLEALLQPLSVLFRCSIRLNPEDTVNGQSPSTVGGNMREDVDRASQVGGPPSCIAGGSVFASFWPGELLRSCIVAISKQLFAHLSAEAMEIQFKLQESAWLVIWSSVTCLPQTLSLEAPVQGRDIASRWVIRTCQTLHAELLFQEGYHCVVLRVPRSMWG